MLPIYLQKAFFMRRTHRRGTPALLLFGLNLVAILGAVLITGLFAPSASAETLPRILLQDGSPCYFRSPFFLRDARGTFETFGPDDIFDPLAAGLRPPFIDRYGDYSGVGDEPGTHTVLAKCGPLAATATLSMPTADGSRHVSVTFPNSAPLVARFVARIDSSVVAGAPAGSLVTLDATASDPDGDRLTFAWGTNAGRIVNVAGNTAQWQLPDSAGVAFAYVLVADGRGSFREAALTVSTDGGIVPAATPPAPPSLPSDKVDASDHFLTFYSTRDRFTFAGNGADSRVGACEYYRSIGAVEGCGSSGEMLGRQLSFDEWKTRWGLDSPGAGFRALYANIRDLDLERDMHGITGPNGTAFYVCNYPHVRAGAVDVDLQNVQLGENLVACVAMEFSPTPGVGGGAPFTKFFVFGPGGQLLQSVNLDQRGEKFLPGVCVVCHAARHGFTRFDESGGTSPDLGAQFLPFDLDNFAYAAASGPLSRSGQEAQFRALNQTLLATQPRSAIVELVESWYPDPENSLFTDAVPSGWVGNESTYRTVVQKYCRTCHVAQDAGSAGRDLSFRRFSDFESFKSELAGRACGLPTGIDRARWSMPNAKTTFDLFWQDSQAIAALGVLVRDQDELRTGCVRP